MYQTNLAYDYESNPTNLVKSYPSATNQKFNIDIIKNMNGKGIYDVDNGKIYEHLHDQFGKGIYGRSICEKPEQKNGGYIDDKNFFGSNSFPNKNINEFDENYYADGIFSDIFNTVKNVFKKIVPHIKKNIPVIKKNYGKVKDIYNTGKELHQNLKNPLKNIGSIVKNVGNISSNIKDVGNAGKELYDDTLNILKPVKVTPEKDDEYYDASESVGTGKKKRKYTKRKS